VQLVRKRPVGEAELELVGGTRVPLGRSFRDHFFAIWRGESPGTGPATVRSV
jgi:hypothetical protein